MKCSHKWQFTCWSGPNIINVEFRCLKCNIRFERKMSKEEKIFYKKNYDLFLKDGIHNVWWDFNKKFRNKPNNDELYGGWKYEGYELIDKIEKWAEKYPDHVRVVSCDDSYHSSSILVLIESKTKDKYHGTTVMFIPQCSGDPPAQFFLYPNRVKDLANTLKGIIKPADETIRRQNKIAAEKSRQWKKILKMPPKDFE